MSLQDNAIKTIIAVFLGVLLLIAAIGAIVLAERAGLQTASNKNVADDGPTGGISLVPPRTGELDRQRAAKLIQEDLARRTVIVRIALGDIVTIDAAGHDRSKVYVALTKSHVIELKFCHFPGVPDGARQVCLAELTRAARRYVQEPASEGMPFRTIVPAGDRTAPPSNRALVDLVLARAQLMDIVTMTKTANGIEAVGYTSTYELTPIAAEFGVTAGALPALPKLATIQKTTADWRLVQE